MSGPKFDPTINLGHILTIGAFMVAAFGTWYGLKADVNAVAVRVVAIERGYDRMAQSIDRLSSIIETSARIDERLKAIERR
jgi:hypothetical protein